MHNTVLSCSIFSSQATCLHVLHWALLVKTCPHMPAKQISTSFRQVHLVNRGYTESEQRTLYFTFMFQLALTGHLLTYICCIGRHSLKQAQCACKVFFNTKASRKRLTQLPQPQFELTLHPFMTGPRYVATTYTLKKLAQLGRITGSSHGSY